MLLNCDTVKFSIELFVDEITCCDIFLKMYKIIFIVFAVFLVQRSLSQSYSEQLKNELRFKHHDNNELIQILNGVNRQCPEITQGFELNPSTVNGNRLYGIIFGINPSAHEPCT